MPGNDAFTTSLLHLDGNLNDTNLPAISRTWSTTGTVSLAGSAKFGSASLSIAATNDGAAYVSTPADDTLWLGGDFTIDFWVNIGALTGSSLRFSQMNSFTVDFSWALSIILSLSGTNGFSASMAVSTNGTSTTAAATKTANGAINTWYHVAVVRSGDTLKVAVNGVFGTAVTFSGSLFHSASDIKIAQFFRSADATALVDEVRVSNTARWTSNFTPPTSQYGGEFIGESARGTYSYTGKAIGTKLARKIVAALGEYTFTGQIATLLYGKIILLAGAGAYAFTGFTTAAFKNGHELALLIAEGGQYIMSSVANYLLRAILGNRLGSPPTLQKTRRRAPTLDE